MAYTIYELKNVVANGAILDIKQLTEDNGFRTEEELEEYIEEEYNREIPEDIHENFEFCFLEMINWIHKEQMEEYDEIFLKTPYTKDKVFHTFRLMAVKENFHYIWNNIKLDPEEEEEEEQTRSEDLQQRLKIALANLVEIV